MTPTLSVVLTIPPGHEAAAARQAYAALNRDQRALLMKFAAELVMLHEPAEGRLLVVADLPRSEAERLLADLG